MEDSDEDEQRQEARAAAAATAAEQAAFCEAGRRLDLSRSGNEPIRPANIFQTLAEGQEEDREEEEDIGGVSEDEEGDTSKDEDILWEHIEE